MTMPRLDEVAAKGLRELSTALFLSQGGCAQKTINPLRENRFSFTIPKTESDQ
jgi:hypothetical protein